MDWDENSKNFKIFGTFKDHETDRFDLMSVSQENRIFLLYSSENH